MSIHLKSELHLKEDVVAAEEEKAAALHREDHDRAHALRIN
jgi:hypothetical protein